MQKRAKSSDFPNKSQKNRKGICLSGSNSKAEPAYLFFAAALSASALITFNQSSVAALKFS